MPERDSPPDAACALAGRTVANLRAAAQAPPLTDRLTALGARVIAAPALRVDPVAGDDPGLVRLRARAGAYGTVIVTSANGARRLAAALVGGLAALDPAATLVAIGPATGRALARLGREPDVVPDRAVAEAVVAALADHDVTARPVLLARGVEGRPEIPRALAARGADVDVVALYVTRCLAGAWTPDLVAAVAGADAVCVTSPSIATCVARALGPARAAAVRGVSIGPPTSARMAALGLPVAAEADPPGLVGLVAAVAAALAGASGDRIAL